LVGPWVWRMSQIMKRVWGWNPLSSRWHFLLYAPGHDSLEMGSWMTECLDTTIEPTFTENDFNKFDGLLEKKLMQLDCDIDEKFGCPPDVLKALRLKTEGCSGSTKTGVRYSVNGTRGSGEPKTTLGNTRINALAHVYTFCRLHRVTPRRLLDWPHAGVGDVEVVPVKSVFHEALFMNDDFYFHQHFSESHYEPLVLPDQKTISAPLFHGTFAGDDGLCITPAKRTPTSHGWQHGMSELGLSAATSVTDRLPLVEFCSALFWPTGLEDGWADKYRNLMYPPRFQLAPKPGRLFSRLGWAEKPVQDDIAWIRGVALGLRNDTMHVPFAFNLISTMLKLTAGVRAKAIYEQQRFRSETPGSMVAATWDFLLERYGLGEQHVEEVVKLLRKVKSFPVLISDPIISRLIAVDMDVSSESMQ